MGATRASLAEGRLMETKFWKLLVRLGVPGVALGIFYKLYDKFDWPLKDLPPNLVFILILVFMGLIFVITLVSLFLWHKSPEIKTTSTDVSIGIPKDCSFQVAAKAIAGDKLISFEGFSERELSSPLQSRQLTAPSAEHLIGKLRDVATRKVRPFAVTIGPNGSYVARVLE